MTIHFHHSNRTASTLLSFVSRRHVPPTVRLDRHFLADVGLSQTDLIALQTR